MSKVKVYVNVYLDKASGSKVVYHNIHLSKDEAKALAKHRPSKFYLFTLCYRADKIVFDGIENQ